MLWLSLGISACTSPPQMAGSDPNSPAPVTEEVSEQMGDMHSGMNHGDHAMDLGPADETYDLRFIDAMIPHHEGAVVMAEDALAKSQRPEIQQLAQEIITAQAQEIAQMQQWRREWYPDMPETPMAWHAQGDHMMPMTEEQRQAMMMAMDLGPADDEYDLRFIEAMIPHHEGAVVMAEDALEKSQRPEIQALAQEIMAAQEQEIAQMQQWQRAWYGTASL